MAAVHFDMGSVLAWVAAGISAIFGVQSYWSSRRAKQAQAAAELQAERATKAAEDAVAAQGQIAAAAERPADATEQQRDAAAEENPWRIERDKGVDRLLNLTATTKYHVRLSGEPVRIDGTRFFYAIAGNDSPRVDLLEPWRVLADRTVTVSWYPTKELAEQAGESKRQQIRL
ncbi:MAG: hypothetical protein J2P16_02060 [Mycobacterium sp.]|nr:hypothetical protein [Mycobacterium sp.]